MVASAVPGIERIDFKVRPKEVKGGDDDSWYVTVSGIAGSAIGTPGLAFGMYTWDPDPTQPGQGGGNNNPNPTPNPNPGPNPNPLGGGNK